MFVKICGITRLEDAEASIEFGADALGFIFAESRRQVNSESVRKITRSLDAQGKMLVGVFNKESNLEVVETVEKAGLNTAQLHGDYSLEDMLWIQQRVDHCIRSVPFVQVETGFSCPEGFRLLIDSDKPGSGKKFDWSTLRNQLQISEFDQEFILAGGLSPNNVQSAIRELNPSGVDVSSGVEASDGVKSRIKIRQFIDLARQSF